jgi:hypothetical protein
MHRADDAGYYKGLVDAYRHVARMLRDAGEETYARWCEEQARMAEEGAAIMTERLKI